MASPTLVPKEILTDLTPLLKLYTDGTVDRLIGSPYVPPSSSPHPTTGVSSKDTTTLDPPARLYLPKLATPNQKLPILLYFHGGGFCLESAFSYLHHRYINILSSEAKALIISVEYRLAPEHPLPAAYHDSWTALNWVCSHHHHHHYRETENDPWISNHGDFTRIFIGGDTAGGNIAHNLAMRVGSEPLSGRLKITGAILWHPFFWGSDPVGRGGEEKEQHMCYRVWVLVGGGGVGIDDPMINPIGYGAPSLSGLGCEKMMVCFGEKDVCTGRGIEYVERLKKSGWGGEVEMVEVKGEGHCFHIMDPHTENAKYFINRMAAFINSPSTS